MAIGPNSSIKPSFKGYTYNKHVRHAGEKAIANTCQPHCTVWVNKNTKFHNFRKYYFVSIFVISFIFVSIKKRKKGKSGKLIIMVLFIFVYLINRYYSTTQPPAILKAKNYYYFTTHQRTTIKLKWSSGKCAQMQMLKWLNGHG